PSGPAAGIQAKNVNQAWFQYCQENFLPGSALQEITSLKRQFTELLSDIGFVKEGLKARVMERMAAKWTDGVLAARGCEVEHTHTDVSIRI
uniref:Uncharacterized protein n=1 Tax=Hucho hucho TaxID=62062 RepID=A0A4W5RD46_9TELE